MADRKATIRLDIKTGGFKRGMKEVADEAEKSSAKAESSIADHMNKGAKAGFQALKGMFDSIKGIAGQVTGLLGGIGFASLVQDTIASQKEFKQLAFRISAGGNALVKWKGLQKEVRDAAVKAKVDIDKLGAGFQAAFQETGDVETARAALDSIAELSKKGGFEMEDLGKTAGVLQQKFGLTNDQIRDGLKQVVAGASEGGAKFEDFAEDLAEIGGKAKTLGLQGPEGLRKMVGFLNLAKKETGNFQQAMTALPQIFDQIIERTSEGVVTSGGKVPIKVQAVDESGKPRDPFAIVQDILKATKGDAAKLGEFGFGGEGLQTLLGIAKSFRTELTKTGGDVEAASANFAKMLDENAGSVENVNEALAGAEDGDAERIQDAINKLRVAFTQPKMISAIEKLATSLPKLADGLASVLDFILSNPLTSGSILAGGSILKAGVGAGIQSAMEAGGKSAASDIGGSIKSGGSAFASTLKGSLAALAVPAITAAVEQLVLLTQDIKDLKGDQKDTDKNLLENAERQGQKGVTREATAQEKFSGLFEKHSDQMSDVVEITRDQQGKVSKRRLSKREVEDRQGRARGEGIVSVGFEGEEISDEEFAAADREQAHREAASRAVKQSATDFSRLDAAVEAERQLGRNLLPGEETQLTQQFEKRSAAGGEGTQAQFVEQFLSGAGKEAARTTAAVKQIAPRIANAELRVRVTNPEDIAGPKKGSDDKDD